jgi:Flp pilus assembly protein TadD
MPKCKSRRATCTWPWRGLKKRVRYGHRTTHCSFRLASLHYDLHRDEQARSYAQEAVSLKPPEWLYHYLLGLIEKRSRLWAQARSCFETASRLNPSAAEVHNALGELALTEGNTPQAIQSFERATQLDPKEEAYRINLDSARRAIRR